MNMAVLILLAILLKSIFTTGVVTVIDDVPCLKGTNHTLKCEFKNRTSVVKWMDGYNGNHIVYCDRDSCNVKSAFEGKYSHSYDLSKNIFNLTILNVNIEDNGRQFVCSDGTNVGCIVLHIGEYEQSLEDTENGTITVTSACSSWDRKVLFKWIKIDPINGEEDEFSPIILNKSETFCLDECGNSGHMKYIETISVASSGNGKKYHLKVAMIYGSERIVSNKTHVAYMIEEQAAEPKYEDSSVTAAAVFASAAVIAVVVVVVVIFCRKRVIRLFHTYFNRAENPINQEEGSESWEERPLNSVDTQAGLQEPEAKIEEKVELMSKTVNGDGNQGSDNGTPSVIPEEDQVTESSLPIPDFYQPMKNTKGNPRLYVR